ncbi:peptide chain release factor N(5)-glutamine methyltransferase [Mycoplasmoides alvi]|uniref:peptide chain release factor N(5)-glutamine methyltransferase n=1 Tax=Mycoplasmoides alvi TaxID=78580 RepID=UPI000696D8A3|nr:peptide chain release factor N(5)-glutamine methyltransferase [Mycoplasmoides alvi]
MTFLELQNKFNYLDKNSFNLIIFYLSKKVKKSSDLIFYRNTDIDFSFNLFNKYYQLHFNKQYPLSYITKNALFYGHNFFVNKHVLIPRNDTEIIVDKFISAVKKTNYTNKNILDLCTGSGCIALSLSKVFPSNCIYATDISNSSLRVAKINKKKLNSKNVIFLKSNFLNCLNKINKYIDYLICNPPYISLNDNNVEFSVKKYEPKKALFTQKNGLKFYIDFVNYILKNNWRPTICCFEFGFNQQESISKLLEKISFFYNISFFKDNNKVDRGFLLTKK